MDRPHQPAIPLRGLLGDLDPHRCKLHCAVWDKSRNPADVLIENWAEWEGWNRWRGPKNDFNRDFIFSLAVLPGQPTHWLFGGVFEVLGRRHTPNSFAYDIRYRDDFLPGHVGRLKVAYMRAGRNTRLVMERALDDITVHEILPLPYAGQAFPGLNRLNVTLRELEVIARQRRVDWQHPLESMKGVYVIHDRATGKAYVGSAYGGTGVWSRWNTYVESLHGHNRDLRELVGIQGDEYARDNLTFALLEFWSMSTPDSEVLEREDYWKRVLLSRGEFGLNAN